MKDYEVLKELIDFSGGYLDVGNITITQEDENEFTIISQSGGMGGTAQELINYLKS